jgi:hypothetical protein
MRLSLVICGVLCGVLWLAPTTSAKPRLKQDRYLAWFEANVTQHRPRGCSTQTLTLNLRSTRPSILVAGRQGKTTISVGGTLRGLAGSFREVNANNCPYSPSGGVVPLRVPAGPGTSLPAELPPLDLVEGSLDLTARPDTAVAFSAFRYSSSLDVGSAMPIARKCCDSATTSLAALLVNAVGSPTPAQLDEAKVDGVLVTGSFSGDLPEFVGPYAYARSLTVTWTLTIRAVFDRHATRIE